MGVDVEVAGPAQAHAHIGSRDIFLKLDNFLITAEALVDDQKVEVKGLLIT